MLTKERGRAPHDLFHQFASAIVKAMRYLHKLPLATLGHLAGLGCLSVSNALVKCLGPMSK